MAKTKKNKTPKQIPFWGKSVNPVTGEQAPEGYFWAKNAIGDGWFLESVGTSFTSSPASETYWCS